MRKFSLLKKFVAIGISASLLVGCGSGSALSDSDKINGFKLEKDESYNGMLIDEVSVDLIRWVEATVAVNFEVDGLYDLDVDETREYLAYVWNVIDSETAVECVSDLVSDVTTGSEGAHNLVSAETVLIMAYQGEYIQFDELMAYAVPVAKVIQQNYESWDDFGDNYVKGYMALTEDGYFYGPEGVTSRMVIQQKYLEEAEYYYEAYAIDYDMELTATAYSTFFDDMPSEPDLSALENKRPGFIEAYIQPERLGDNPISGNVEIDGDLYHMPFNVQQLLDYGWEIDASCAGKNLLEETNETLFNRNGKQMTLEICANSDDGSVENGYVEKMSTDEVGDVDIVFPSGITSGTPITEVKSAIDRYNVKSKGGSGAIDVYPSAGDYKLSYCRILGLASVDYVLFSSGGMESPRSIETFYEHLADYYDDYIKEAELYKSKTMKFRNESKDAE